MTVVSAPGKAFLIGEYGVLHGGAAIVTAMDVRAVAHVARPEHEEHPQPTAPFVAAAEAQIEAQIDGQIDGQTPVVTTLGFDMGRRKLGLGSSAAVTVAVIGYHLARAGHDLRAPETQDLALHCATQAHAQAQGGVGSGGDIAASLRGGTLVCKPGPDAPADAASRCWSSIDIPDWLHIGFFDAGAPASTRARLEALRGAENRAPKPFGAAMASIKGAANDLLASWESSDGFVALRAAVARHNAGLSALEALVDIAIFTPCTETIIETAQSMGLAAKPSGAGGGDLVVVFAADRASLDRLAARLRRDAGIAMVSGLEINAPGLRREVSPPLNSRLKGFFRLDVATRRSALSAALAMDPARFDDANPEALGVDAADHMIENVVGCLAMPLAVATNFRINGRDVLVPMCVEEASVVAAASNAAKMVRTGGGFAAHSDPPWMIAQIQLLRPSCGVEQVEQVEQVTRRIKAAEAELLAIADLAHPRLIERGGGAREIEVRPLDAESLVVHVLVDCQDAMGANLVNTVAERVAPELESISGWRARLRILSNLADRRACHVRARLPAKTLATTTLDGDAVAERIVEASRFAEIDPYRATTHNKGIMNGVDAVVLATGNDWRAVEAAAHAFAARTGTYRPLATWRRTDSGDLEGKLTLPTAVGVVGGATRVHPTARLALEILGAPSGVGLGQVMAAAGLASNLAALRALATEGIQRGHMTLHARTVAASVGATGPEVERIALQLVTDQDIKVEHAEILLQRLRGE